MPRPLLAAAFLAVLLFAATASGAPGAARTTVVIGQEEDVSGFNTALTCCSELWGGVLTEPVIRGAYIVNDRLQHVRDLVAGAHATEHTLTYTIRRNAYWNWGGRKLPVTWEDFAYTWQQLVDPKNAVVDRDGYDQITGFTHAGLRRITFTWKQPYGDWQDLFDRVYPSPALQGVDFNTMWQSCICGSDGRPIADGPYFLASYARGEGSTLSANPFWYGKKPAITTIVFKLMPSRDAELQAMRNGSVDAIEPGFGVDLLPLKSTRGIRYGQSPGLEQEHIDIQLGKQGNPLLRAPWMRRALLKGIDRSSIIDTVLGQFAGNGKPLNSAVYFPGDTRYRPDFARWTSNQKQALAILRAHCVGGPTTPSAGNTAIFGCTGFQAQFRFAYAPDNPVRATQEQLIAQQLEAIGIQIVASPQAASAIPSGNWDLADFSWTTSPDPSAFVPVWSCLGPANFLGYCNHTATTLLAETTTTVDQAQRSALFERADRVLARDVPTIPLYARPSPLVWNAKLVGPGPSPWRAGFLWNVERWRWRG